MDRSASKRTRKPNQRLARGAQALRRGKAHRIPKRTDTELTQLPVWPTIRTLMARGAFIDTYVAFAAKAILYE